MSKLVILEDSNSKKRNNYHANYQLGCCFKKNLSYGADSALLQILRLL